MFPPPGHLFPAAFLVPHEEFVSEGQCRPEDAEMCIPLALLRGYFTHSWFGYTFQLIFLYSELCKLNLWFVISPACGASQMFGCSLCKPCFSRVLQQLLTRKHPKPRAPHRKYAEHSRDVLSWASFSGTDTSGFHCQAEQLCKAVLVELQCEREIG